MYSSKETNINRSAEVSNFKLVKQFWEKPKIPISPVVEDWYELKKKREKSTDNILSYFTNWFNVNIHQNHFKKSAKLTDLTYH